MMSNPNDAKREQLARAAEAAAHFSEPEAAGTGRGEPPDAFLAAYYRHVAAEDILARDPSQLSGFAFLHRRLAMERPTGSALVRVQTPTSEADGWPTTRSLVQIVTDDMPFLVTSVTAELTRQGRAIHLVIHPQLQVRRNSMGHLVEVMTDENSSVSPDRIVESWISVEIDRESHGEAAEQMARGVRQVLEDVRVAVEDGPAMGEHALQATADLRAYPPAGVEQADVEEASKYLDWLGDERFSFLGYAEYHRPPDGTLDGNDKLAPAPDSGLGLLRPEQPQASRLLRHAATEPADAAPLTVTKSSERSTVHRPLYLDDIAVGVFDVQGRPIGRRQFLGLFTSAAYHESVLRIPMLRRKVAALLERMAFSPTSHSGRDVIEILEDYPRDELVQVSLDELEHAVVEILHLQERRQLRLFLRHDHRARYVSALVYLPRERYTTAACLRLEQILRDTFDANRVEYTTLVSDSVLARLHFVVRRSDAAPLAETDHAELERRLADAIRSWSDDLTDTLTIEMGDEEAARLLRVYGEAFPQAYQEDYPADVAVADLLRIDALQPDDDHAVNLYVPAGVASDQRRLKLFCAEPVSLSTVSPILQGLGVEVIDERPYELTPAEGARRWIYDFGLRYDVTAETSPEAASQLFEDAFAAVWSGAAESDGFNALVLHAGLNWRQAVLVRAYAKYLRQVGIPFSEEYLQSCLLANVDIVRLLLRLFEARFDPEAESGGKDVGQALVHQIRRALDEVASLDEDRILRSLLRLIRATTRTNFFQLDEAGMPGKSYLSLKFDPQAISELPEPRPRFEIFVYSPRVEGVHLRFGAVARGGLRWSDRRDDFRTEVLGLVKAQMVKNTVIVPVGAKGGFVVKSAPGGAHGREALMREGVDCYRIFIRGLLDLTDNLVNGQVVPPEGVVRHDSDDPYLVVAADKGTATFSDIANGVAADYNFWLGDAFASGGSVGYDHKAMGITARGAWESVKRHFRELGIDTQSENFTVVGIGDMSGDVFGNGMLLSEHIRLVAAFDHRHIFLDPDPDAAVSYAERRRLFALPRSSWADYDTELLSAGGGVYPRTAKEIPLAVQSRVRLGLADDIEALTPAELIRSILSAPVDLLWNGGIGTYIKATAESHADIGDKANDPIRLNGSQVRARVIGEGGNLGLSQLGRIEYAKVGADGTGGRINTDAIDNSAGVDTSDHEVNIKILLDRIVLAGALADKDRSRLLTQMTDEVARLVLRDNIEQNVALSVARAQAPAMLPVHRRLMAHLERQGDLDRALEFLPDDEELDQRAASGHGLTSPELSVLLAYAKITNTTQLLQSDLAEASWFERVLRAYFPSQLVERYGNQLNDHPLRREIITTSVVNDMINRAGITFSFRTQEATGASPDQIARAYTVVREVFGLSRFWAAVESAGVPVAAATALHLEGRRLLDRAVRWLLQSRQARLDVAAEISRFQPQVADLAPRIPELVQGFERERLRARAAHHEGLRTPAPLALAAAALLDVFSLLDIVEIAEAADRPDEQVASLYFTLSERFNIDRLLTLITALPQLDRWQSMARSALRSDLYAALADITSDVLATTNAQGSTSEIELADRWEAQNSEGLAQVRNTMAAIDDTGTWDLAELSVALRAIRTLVRS
jgi:glutamate dehydrogenase